MCPSNDPSPAKQRTISRPVSLSGIGLHRGRDCSITFHPAEEDHGIVFSYDNNLIPALAENVTGTERGVSLGKIILVEHVLAACAGLGLDNLIIELTNPEPPAMDGSAREFVSALKSAQIMEQKTKKEFLIITEKIQVGGLTLSPCNGLKIDYMLDFSVIGKQEFKYSGDFEAVASARTFGLASEVEKLRSSGLAKGASLENALAIGPKGFINSPRFPDEPARHKVLDLLGDLMLVGRPLKGAIKAKKTGHKQNLELALLLRRKFNAA